AAEGPTPRAPAPGETLRGAETVLVTEDDEQVRRSIVRMLSGLGIPGRSRGERRPGARRMWEGHRDRRAAHRPRAPRHERRRARRASEDAAPEAPRDPHVRL